MCILPDTVVLHKHARLDSGALIKLSRWELVSVRVCLRCARANGWNGRAKNISERQSRNANEEECAIYDCANFFSRSSKVNVVFGAAEWIAVEHAIRL